MLDDLTPRRSLFAVWRWPKRVLIPLAMLLTLGYPLSVGPAVWLYSHGYLLTGVEQVAVAFYMPLTWLCQNCEPARDLVDWYAELWRAS